MKESCFYCVVTFVCLTLCSFAGDGLEEEALFEAAYEEDSLYLLPLSEYQSFKLTVSGPDNIQFTQQFQGQETPSLSCSEENSLPDGLYSFELKAAPIVSEEMRNTLTEARAKGVRPAVLPRGNSQSGSFYVIDGSILHPKAEDSYGFNKGDEEPDVTPGDADPGRDVVHLDDGIITGSLCVGFDCVNGESFGFDTLRIKENNLRVQFKDTSNSASFPTNDWRLIANDSSNGGLSYFGIEDSETARIPFRVEAGAPANALYVDSTGRVGVGTSNPVVELHAIDGDTPTVRLEQDGSSGFAAQTWDVAGNETNFFIRDTSNGSKLPFRILPDSPGNSLYISPTGVGFGTASPSAQLDVVGTTELNGATVINDSTELNGDVDILGNGVDLLIEDSNTSSDSRIMFALKNKGPVLMVMQNTSPSIIWDIGVDNQGLSIGDTTGSTALQIRDSGETILTSSTGIELFKLAASGETIIKSSTGVELFKLAASGETTITTSAGDQIFHLSDTGDLTIPGTLTSSKRKSDVALKALADAKDAKIAEMELTLQAQEARLQLLEQLLLK